MTLGERIKEQRKKLNYSQEKIAEMVGTSRQAVTKWETDLSMPCMENMIRLAEVFGISLNELTTGTGENNARKKKGKPLLPLLHNLSIIGYVLMGAASAGLHSHRSVPAIMWIIIALLGGLCIMIRNVKYHEQYGKLPSLLSEVIYLTILFLVPRIPLPNGYATVIMQIMAIVYILIYVYKLCPWRKDKKTNIGAREGE